MDNTSTFIYVLKLLKREISSAEEATIDEHFEYLKKGQAEGKVILAGPCLDGEFGIVVFRAESGENAKRFMMSDPAVKKKIMKAELHPFRVSIVEKT